MEKRFRKIYSQDVELPEAIREQVSVVSCLAYGEKRQVYLTEDIRRRRFILKTAQEEQVRFLRKDAEMLREHPFSFLPEYEQYLEVEEKGYLLREYISGDTLWEWVNKKGPFSVREADEILCRICDMAGQLHGQEPPVIHRDLKPQNIVMTPERNLFFIDLGTARNYNKDMNQDTVFVGTKPTAAPEQYGYRQTDARADIYALGVLYLFLLTGSLKVQDFQNREDIPAGMRRIIRKCTRMDPDDRYQNCEELKRDVLSQREKKLFLRRRPQMAALSMAGMLAAAGLEYLVRVYCRHTKKEW